MYSKKYTMAMGQARSVVVDNESADFFKELNLG